MEFFVEEGKHLHDECSTLVLPALSIGNVGQLALDLLVSTMRAERIGYLDTPFVLPCVGNDAYVPTPQGHLALPLEAYESPSNALTLLQQRSPIVKGTIIEFAKNLADFAAASGKKHVVLLSSLDFGRWQRIDVSRFIKACLKAHEPDKPPVRFTYARRKRHHEPRLATETQVVAEVEGSTRGEEIGSG
ncbi:hypothetical protein L484_026984 [Morus notabilis]|uniref:Proteasome assembly chaperone 2 n=1 Tax=Morus notabilis TaxID=981085 RepID=W9RPL1_9ROSA|nr:hypothetical protein L484_026984 [Morus notabilis]